MRSADLTWLAVCSGVVLEGWKVVSGMWERIGLASQYNVVPWYIYSALYRSYVPPTPTAHTSQSLAESPSVSTSMSRTFPSEIEPVIPERQACRSLSEVSHTRWYRGRQSMTYDLLIRLRRALYLERRLERRCRWLKSGLF